MTRPDGRLAALHVADGAAGRLYRLAAARPAFDHAARAAVLVWLRADDTDVADPVVAALADLAGVRDGGALGSGRDLYLLLSDDDDAANDRAGDDDAIAAALSRTALVLTDRRADGHPLRDATVAGRAVHEIATTRRAGARAHVEVDGPFAAEALLDALGVLRGLRPALRPTADARALLDAVGELGGLKDAMASRAATVAATSDAALRRLQLPMGWRRGLLRDHVCVLSVAAPADTDADAAHARADIAVELAADADADGWLDAARAALDALDAEARLVVHARWSRATSPAHGPFFALLSERLERMLDGSVAFAVALPALAPAWQLASPERPTYGVFPLRQSAGPDPIARSRVDADRRWDSAEATLALLRAIVEEG